ncbi:MAG: tetratricopeptide repeat protein [Caldimonas sp.]
MLNATSPIEELVARIIGFVNSGRLNDAETLCERALTEYPEQPAVLQLSAVLDLRAGRAVEAVRHAAASLRLRPDHIPTLVAAGDAAGLCGNHIDAASYFERAHALDPSRMPVRLKLATAQHRGGLLPEARDTIERFVADAPDEGDAWFVLALVLQDLRDFDGAADALRRVLRLMPHRAEAETNLGIVLQASGRIDEAMKAYARAYRLRPKTFGRIAHALAAESTGQVWTDLDALRSALQSTPP